MTIQTEEPAVAHQACYLYHLIKGYFEQATALPLREEKMRAVEAAERVFEEKHRLDIHSVTVLTREEHRAFLNDVLALRYNSNLPPLPGRFNAAIASYRQELNAKWPGYFGHDISLAG